MPETTPYPTVERCLIAPGFVDDALQCLRRRGLAEAPLLERAGLPPMVTTPVSVDQYGMLWLAIAEAIDDEFFGEGAHAMRSGSFALLCHAVLTAKTLGQALRRALRFLSLIMDDPQAELSLRDGLAQVVLKDQGAARSAFAYRTYWIIVYGIHCWLVGRRIPLRRVEFRCSLPADRSDYSSFFGTPVRFGAPESRLTFDASILSLPTIRDEQELKDFLRHAPANILVRYRHDAGLVARVRLRLRAQPATAWLPFDALAHQLRMSATTLRRRLADEGQTYQSIKDELRRIRAESLLRNSNRSLEEIAADLGFSEPSAFHRAFRKWTAQSPGAYRRAKAG